MYFRVEKGENSLSGEAKEVIAVIAGVAVLIAGYIKLFFPERSHKYKFIKKAEAKGYYKTATLIDSIRICGNPEAKSSYNKYDRMKCIYEYKVNGVSYKKKLIFRSQGTVSIRYPYEITIYYNPRHPSRGVCKEDVRPTAGCFLTIVFAGITIRVIYELLNLL